MTFCPGKRPFRVFGTTFGSGRRSFLVFGVSFCPKPSLEPFHENPVAHLGNGKGREVELVVKLELKDGMGRRGPAQVGTRIAR